ncbi:DHH family phosphoesterase [Patescibacteria group bacterium]|nr:DHH family phosphoesterase [Patescibacteria group bacterium]
MNYKWSTKPKASDDIIEQLLINRGLTKREEQERFLNPDWERDTHDPMQFKQMEDAVDRVFLALESGEPIAIHGDYDADGVCGSALLFSVLEVICHKLGFGTSSISVFLPDRERDGYGVAMHTVERLVKEGVKLLITVDCGIANADQLEHAHELGTDVIICDHHQLAERLPKHAIILHPLAPGEDYPNKFLCGTGVAFKLGSALISHARKRGAALPEGYEKWFLDFVAIAMVTDVMPLLKENRTLEKFGLKVLNKSRRLGIRKIVELSRSDFGSIDTQAVGFQIGPRINAAGRVRSAKIAFNALVAKTEDEAQKLKKLRAYLNREIRGQQDAIHAVVDTLTRNRAGVQNPSKPLG